VKGIPILEKVHPHLFTLNSLETIERLEQDFLRAYTIISSRTFVVDMYHGLCMVPIADMFNHSNRANTHFEADDEVCDECGSLGACPHNDDPLPSEAYGRPSAMLKAESGPNSEEWEAPIELKGVDTVDMVAQETITNREQLFSTYGNFTNANLLTTYGFGLEWETDWERYVWEWRYEEEREELLDLFDRPLSSSGWLLSESIGQRRQSWIKACSQFTNLSEQAFAELADNDEQLFWKKTLDVSADRLTMPINSPFVALTKPAEVPKNGVKYKDAAALSDSIKDFVAELSTHDESKDMYQPLFIDNQGRVSLSLWRAAMLYRYTVWVAYHQSSTTIQMPQFIYLMEDRLSRVLDDDIPESITDEDGWYWLLLQEVLSILRSLVMRRLDKIQQSQYAVFTNSTSKEDLKSLLSRVSNVSSSGKKKIKCRANRPRVLTPFFPFLSAFRNLLMACSNLPPSKEIKKHLPSVTVQVGWMIVPSGSNICQITLNLKQVF
jgi:hypothetical protein